MALVPTYRPSDDLAPEVPLRRACGESMLTGDWWMVVDRSGERILHRSTSLLEAFRVARRRTGGAVCLTTAPGFGFDVVGRRSTVTVVRVPGNQARPARVAIAVAPDDRKEQVRLPDGSSFTWIPVAAIAAASAASVTRTTTQAGPRHRSR